MNAGGPNALVRALRGFFADHLPRVPSAWNQVPRNRHLPLEGGANELHGRPDRQHHHPRRPVAPATLAATAGGRVPAGAFRLLRVDRGLRRRA
jgi:hypothetical protein